jgi:hypothetical protein
MMHAVGSERIEVEKARAIEFVSALHEAFDIVDLRETFQQRIAVVVIADEKPIRYLHRLQLSAQRAIGSFA